MKNEQERRRLHEEYKQAAATAAAYARTPYGKVFAKLRDDAVDNLIRYYEAAQNIAPISEKTTLQK